MWSEVATSNTVTSSATLLNQIPSQIRCRFSKIGSNAKTLNPIATAAKLAIPKLAPTSTTKPQSTLVPFWPHTNTLLTPLLLQNLLNLAFRKSFLWGGARCSYGAYWVGFRGLRGSRGNSTVCFQRVWRCRGEHEGSLGSWTEGLGSDKDWERYGRLWLWWLCSR